MAWAIVWGKPACDEGGLFNAGQSDRYAGARLRGAA